MFQIPVTTPTLMIMDDIVPHSLSVFIMTEVEFHSLQRILTVSRVLCLSRAPSNKIQFAQTPGLWLPLLHHLMRDLVRPSEGAPWSGTELWSLTLRHLLLRRVTVALLSAISRKGHGNSETFHLRSLFFTFTFTIDSHD